MRSKAEAQIASWFDKQNLAWQYEPESIIGNVQYTPDFYLPSIDTIIEVKPLLFIREVERAVGIVESLLKTFVVLAPLRNGECEIVDMFGPLQFCDPINPGSENGGVSWGWHSDSPEDRPVSFDDFRMDRSRFYIGAGCYWRHKNGHGCSCTN